MVVMRSYATWQADNTQNEWTVSPYAMVSCNARTNNIIPRVSWKEINKSPSYITSSY